MKQRKKNKFSNKSGMPIPKNSLITPIFLLINRFNHIYINQPVQMTDVNHVIIPFEGKINP